MGRCRNAAVIGAVASGFAFRPGGAGLARVYSAMLRTIRKVRREIGKGSAERFYRGVNPLWSDEKGRDQPASLSTPATLSGSVVEHGLIRLEESMRQLGPGVQRPVVVDATHLGVEL